MTTRRSCLNVARRRPGATQCATQCWLGSRMTSGRSDRASRAPAVLSLVGTFIAVALCAQAAWCQSTEIVPTSLRQRAMWRYTVDRPADGWQAPAFDDSHWKTGPGVFGTRGTPGVAINTNWS